MSISEGKVSLSFLCDSCLSSESFTTDETNDIMRDIMTIQGQARTKGWKIVTYYPYTRYYCPECREAASDFVMSMEKKKMQRVMGGS